MPTPVRKYRHVRQSEGEVHKLPLNANGEEIRAIGTSGCRTCMCVYVRFNGNTVFVAHIVAQCEITESEQDKMPENRRWGEQQHLAWTSDLNRGLKLKRKVEKQLRSQLDLGEVVVDEAFVVCPAISVEGRISNGFWLEEAVREVFGLEDLVVCWGHGFVAGPDIDTVFFQWGGLGNRIHSKEELAPAGCCWTACDGVEKQGRVLGFVYEDGRWFKEPNWQC